jgi:hypothetical protein
MTSVSAFAATKTEVYKCVSTEGKDIKTAKKASQCYLPNHWVKTKEAKPVAKKTTNSHPTKG